MFGCMGKNFQCLQVSFLWIGKSSSHHQLQIRVETCTDPCGLNRSDETASTAADDDQIRVETCTDPCGHNQSDEAASTAADDDQIIVKAFCISASTVYKMK